MPRNNRFLTQQVFYFRSQFPEKRKWIISLKKQKASGSSFGPKEDKSYHEDDAKAKTENPAEYYQNEEQPVQPIKDAPKEGWSDQNLKFLDNEKKIIYVTFADYAKYKKK